jgi:hypothetical protein
VKADGSPPRPVLVDTNPILECWRVGAYAKRRKIAQLAESCGAADFGT